MFLFISDCHQHEYGIKIETLDNPGWSVEIDLAGTPLEGESIPYSVKENGENDWVGYYIRDDVFRGNGDPSKLDIIIAIFREIWESKVDSDSSK